MIIIKLVKLKVKAEDAVMNEPLSHEVFIMNLIRS